MYCKRRWWQQATWQITQATPSAELPLHSLPIKGHSNIRIVELETSLWHQNLRTLVLGLVAGNTTSA